MDRLEVDRPLSKTVFILGAGASREAGAPLMNDFLDRAKDLLYGGGLPDADKCHFENVFRALGDLQPVQSKVALDLNNLESVFATFEMARTLGTPPTLGDGADPAGSLRVLISATLEQCLKFQHLDTGIFPGGNYESFGKLVKYLRWERRPSESVAIITFNYDVALDQTLGELGLGPDYCFDGPPEGGGIPLLKLHGSLNWRQCLNKECRRISAANVSSAIQFSSNVGRRSDGTIRFFARRAEISCRSCHTAIAGEPYVVPPTWTKGEYRTAIEQPWRQAAAELREAENIIVAGFSAPASDGFFEQLLALGTLGPNPLRRFCVFDPDPSVAARFKAKLGPGALARFSTPVRAEHAAFPLLPQQVEDMFKSGALRVPPL